MSSCRFLYITACVVGASILASTHTASAQPTAELHVVDNDFPRVFVERPEGAFEERTMFRLENVGKVRFAMVDSFRDAIWTFDNSGRFFTINRDGNGPGTEEFRLDSNTGNLKILGVLEQNSSRELKKDLEHVDSRQILKKIVDLPVLEWTYKHDSTNQRHVGPVAEQFNDTFALNGDRRSISPSDMNGLAFAAIQGLNAIVDEKDTEIASLREQNEQFATRLAQIEQQLAGLQK